MLRAAASAGWFVLLLLAVCLESAEAASFGSESSVNTTINTSGKLSCADVDSDGDVDLIVVDETASGKVTWFANNGSGTSWTRNDLSTTLNTGYGVYAADIDSDGDTDLLAAANADNALWIFTNNGSQTFTGTSLTTSNKPMDVVAVDVDGDGDLDLVSAGRELEWFQQTGTNSGNFSATATNLDAGNLLAVFAADLDADGDADLIVSDNGSNRVRVYLNNGSGTFTSQTLTSGTSGTPDGIAAGDMDNDGDLDVVAAWYAGNGGRQIGWYAQSGVNSGTFTNTSNAVDSDVDGPRGLYVDDVDGDGIADVVAFVADDNSSAPGERSILWYANNGTGTSFTKSTIQTGFSASNVNDTGSVCLADLNGDGLQDVAAVSDTPNKISWWAGSATAGATIANSTALALGWMEECARTWNGTSYVLIAPKSGAVCSSNTTALGVWEGFWVLANQQLELVVPPRPGSATKNTTDSLAGITSSQYRLIGVPLDPTDGDAGTVLGDDLGGAAAYETKWRVAKFNVSTSAYQLYTGSGTVPNFLPGRGFWLIHDGSVASPATIDVSGSELKQVVGSPPCNGARVIDLSKPGADTAKHMAANPFDYTVNWGLVKFRRPQNPSQGVTARLESPPAAPAQLAPRTMTAAMGTPSTALDRVRARLTAAGGYLARLFSLVSERDGGRFASTAFRSPEGSASSVADRWRPLRSGESHPEGLVRGSPSNRRWLLDLQVRSAEGRAEDLYNRLGVVPGSLDGRDRHDALDLAPVGSGWVRLYFPHDDPSLRAAYWAQDPEELTNDIRCPRRGRIEWIFAVESNEYGREWMLSWPTVDQLPAGLRLRLVDLATGRALDPRRTSEYRFRVNEPRRLFLLEADASRIAEESGELRGVVTDASGRPVRTALEVSSTLGYRHSIQTDGLGRYHLYDLDPGTYTLELRVAEGAPRLSTAEVKVGRSIGRVFQVEGY